LIGAPIAELQPFITAEKPKWLAYKTYLLAKKVNKNIPVVAKPSSHWTKPQIRTPLMNFFLKNCAYCGIYTDANNQGEVDHLIPNAEDTAADLVYSWDNYVWACHSCNNKKNDHHPVLNPCSAIEMASLEFLELFGVYRIKPGTTQEIIEKFDITHSWTYINGKNHRARRKNIARRLRTIYLDNLHRYTEIYNLEGPASTEGVQAKAKIDEAVSEIKSLFEENEYLLLIRDVFESFHHGRPLPYSFNQFYERLVP
jgi:hypothetical protein